MVWCYSHEEMTDKVYVKDS